MLLRSMRIISGPQLVFEGGEIDGFQADDGDKENGEE